MASVKTLILTTLMAALYALKPKDFWYSWFSTQSYLSENVKACTCFVPNFLTLLL